MNHDEINWDGVDGGAQDEIQFSFPVVQWRNGNSELEDLGPQNINYCGGFFFPFEHVSPTLAIPGWTKAYFKSAGKRIDGLAAHSATIAIVRIRRRWFRKGGARTEYRAWERYQSGFRAQMQAVGFVQGFEEPVVFAWKGMATNSVDDARKEHQKLISLVNRSSPKKGVSLPGYALWMTLEAGPHGMVGKGDDKSEATLPRIVQPAELTLEYARTRYVGNTRLAEWQSLYRELDRWFHEWDQGTVSSAGEEEMEIVGAGGDEEAKFYARGRAAGLLDADLDRIAADVYAGGIDWRDAMLSLP